MGKLTTRNLYFIFAAWTFLAVSAVAIVVSILQFEGLRSQTEDNAAEAVQQSLVPVLAVNATDAATFGAAADDLIGERVAGARLWSENGDLLGEAGGGAPADAEAAADAMRDGGATVKATTSGGGEVLVSYSRLATGDVVEIAQDYGPVAASISHLRLRLMLTTIASSAATLVLLQTILWAATRGLRTEYDRLVYLHRSGQAIRSSLDLPDVLEQLARDAALYTRSQFGLAALLDADTDELLLRASYEMEAQTSSQHSRGVEAWFLRRAAATGETLIDRQDQIDYRTILGHEPTIQAPVYFITASIPGREGAIGVISVLRHTEHGKFRAHEIQMVEEMAAQGAMAVEQATLFDKVRAYADEVELSYDGTLRALMAALDTKDSVTQGHSERVARLTVQLAKEMEVPADRLVDIERGALLHDVGKIGVPDDVLQKPGTLDEREWEAMQKHPLLAGLMISKVGFLEGALPILLYHHESYDGSGYPFGLKGKAIPLEARLFTVVDSYDAMTSDRPYRKAMSQVLALGEIQKNAGIQFDPEVCEAFTRLINRMHDEDQRAAA